MEPLLYLVHRIPYPPDKGDKIRSFHVLRWLARRFDVHLGCFVDDPADLRHEASLARYCATTRCIELHPVRARLRSIAGLLSRSPLTLPYYRSTEMHRWVRTTVERHRIARAYAFSSSMAQYLEGARYARLRRVIDLVDVDSDKWRQYASHASPPMSWLYRREHRRLGHYEHRISAEFDATTLVSPEEARLFAERLPASLTSRVHAVENGVDAEHFAPGAAFDPVDAQRVAGVAPYICFTGAMDYWANVHAVVWFTEKVWGQVHADTPHTRFYIVGSNPTAEVRALARYPGVEVTGRVNDVRPYIAGSRGAVAPLRIARGVQNKVLEALALARPVIATSMAMEGIAHRSGLDIEITDAPEPTRAAVAALLAAPRREADANRRFVLDRYGWDARLESLTALLIPD